MEVISNVQLNSELQVVGGGRMRGGGANVFSVKETYMYLLVCD